MPLWTLALISLGVSADAFAVAVGKGLSLQRFAWRQALMIAVTFGAFQAAMPLLGWLLGSQFAPYITAVDHWVAFAILAVVGGKMIYEALNASDGEPDTALSLRNVLVLGLATSIDALAVGIGFAMLPVSILPSVAMIGVTTAALSLAGVWIGVRVGARLARPAEIAGGVILIAIGIKILIDHLWA